MIKTTTDYNLAFIYNKENGLFFEFISYIFQTIRRDYVGDICYVDMGEITLSFRDDIVYGSIPFNKSNCIINLAIILNEDILPPAGYTKIFQEEYPVCNIIGIEYVYLKNLFLISNFMVENELMSANEVGYDLISIRSIDRARFFKDYDSYDNHKGLISDNDILIDGIKTYVKDIEILDSGIQLNFKYPHNGMLFITKTDVQEVRQVCIKDKYVIIVYLKGVILSINTNRKPQHTSNTTTTITSNNPLVIKSISIATKINTILKFLVQIKKGYNFRVSKLSVSKFNNEYGLNYDVDDLEGIFYNTHIKINEIKPVVVYVDSDIITFYDSVDKKTITIKDVNISNIQEGLFSPRHGYDFMGILVKTKYGLYLISGELNY